MKYDDFKDMIGKRVRVTTHDGKQFSGLFTNTESEFDTTSGEEEIELRMSTTSGAEHYYVGIEFSAIAAMELLDKTA